MDDLLLVQVGQRVDALLRDPRDLTFAQDGLSHNVRQRPSLEILHAHPEFPADQITLNIVDNVLVLVLAHDFDLCDDQFLLRLIVQVHLLDRHGPTRLDVGRLAHRTGRAEMEIVYEKFVKLLSRMTAKFEIVLE